MSLNRIEVKINVLKGVAMKKVTGVDQL